MEKELIKGGLTNISYKIKKNNFYFFRQEWNDDLFNHKLNLSLLNDFDFVPKLIYEGKNFATWEYIEGKNPNKSSVVIIEVAHILKKLHFSKKKFPKANHFGRLNQYIKEISNKKVSKEIDIYKELAFNVVKKFENNTPLHNDPWLANVIQSDKLYLVDWEYASMGDKHVDLAFFIEASNLNKKEEQKFLKAYGNFNKEKLERSKFFVNYLTLIWLERHEILPFDNTIIKKKTRKFAKLIK